MVALGLTGGVGEGTLILAGGHRARAGGGEDLERPGSRVPPRCGQIRGRKIRESRVGRESQVSRERRSSGPPPPSNPLPFPPPPPCLRLRAPRSALPSRSAAARTRCVRGESKQTRRQIAAGTLQTRRVPPPTQGETAERRRPRESRRPRTCPRSLSPVPPPPRRAPPKRWHTRAGPRGGIRALRNPQRAPTSATTLYPSTRRRERRRGAPRARTGDPARPEASPPPPPSARPELRPVPPRGAAALSARSDRDTLAHPLSRTSSRFSQPANARNGRPPREACRRPRAKRVTGARAGAGAGAGAETEVAPRGGAYVRRGEARGRVAPRGGRDGHTKTRGSSETSVA